MKIVYFEVKGEPIGQSRPRMNRKGWMYKPAKDKKYEKAVTESYANAAKGVIFEDAVMVTINAYYQRPKKSKLFRPTKKPDIDNVAKIVLDGLNGIAYADDKQVIQLIVNKWWSENNPRIYVSIEEVF